jgi:ADP-heptose:LPS heptosyltransferase
MEKNKVRITLALGNVGDTIMCLPAARFAMENPMYNLEKTELYTNYVELAATTDITYYCDLLTIRAHHEGPDIMIKAEIPRGLGYHEPLHRVDEAYWWLGYEPRDIPIEEKNYPKFMKDKLLPKKFSKPIVVVAGTWSCRRRKFSDRVMYRTCRYLKSKGYLPVIVGLTERFMHKECKYGTYNVNYEGCANLVDKLRPQELLSVISEAKAVVSPDSGIIHMAALTDVPIIGYYTIIGSDYIAPIRNDVVGGDCIMINAPLTCQSCYSRTNNLWVCTERHQDDLRKGYYKEGDADCVKALTVSTMIEALKQIGI